MGYANGGDVPSCEHGDVRVVKSRTHGRPLFSNPKVNASEGWDHTEEQLEELECTAKVSSVAMFEDETGAGWIAAGCEDGTLKVWDAGVLALIPLNPHAQN